MECPRLPEIPYGEFSLRLHRQGLEQRFPLGVTLELTARCNLRCAHCYINRPAGDRQAQAEELSVQDWTRLLAEMSAAGTLWLLLTGGEPLLRRDFQEIYLAAKRAGMIITLFTNGTLITPEIADFWQEFPPFAVEITVYGLSRETYEQVTRVPGSHQRCFQGIEMLLARKLPLALKTSVMSLNVHELWDLKNWAAGRGVPFRFDAVLNARLDGGTTPLGVRLPPAEVVALDLQDEGRMSEWQEFVQKYLGPPPDPELLFHCGAGLNNFHVDASGTMFPCLMMRTEGFDLTRGSVQEGWQDFIPHLRDQKARKQTPCRRCRLISLCGQCPAWATLEYGNQEAPVDYLCDIAHRRARALGLDPGSKMLQREE
jgi:radical SAM protein with 4Fe4S-binding SPASM domain